MEEHPQYFNLLPKRKEWHDGHKLSEDNKLELRLGPPGEFPGYKIITTSHGAKRVLEDTPEAEAADRNWFTDVNGKHCKKFSTYEEAVDKLFPPPWLSDSLHCSTYHRVAQKELQQTKPSHLQCSREVQLQCLDKKACPSPVSASFSATTHAGTNNSHKSLETSRVALAPVVGWPPIRSSRKNLASNSASKLAPELPNKTPIEGISIKPASNSNDLFIKINMEGVPIGRKINLNAYDSYEKLSIAIDELFRGLLAAQRETSAARSKNKMDAAKPNADSEAENGEYTLVYEDNEGDRVLVGDVPWHMFVSTAKRLHVLKSSELSTPQHSVGSK